MNTQDIFEQLIAATPLPPGIVHAIFNGPKPKPLRRGERLWIRARWRAKDRYHFDLSELDDGCD